jgi:hypothetical protein
MMRQSADYAAVYDPDERLVSETLREGRAFLDAARGYLERRSGGMPG